MSKINSCLKCFYRGQCNAFRAIRDLAITDLAAEDKVFEDLGGVCRYALDEDTVTNPPPAVAEEQE